MGRLLNLATLALAVFPQRGMSLVGPNLDPITIKLEETVGRSLTPSERESLEYQRQIVENLHEQVLPVANRRAPLTTVLYCMSGGIDVYVSFSASGCFDSALNPYYVIATEAGLTVGISSALYTLVYRSYDGSEIPGKYYGGSVSGAWGTYGATVGMFYPFESSPSHSSRRLRRMNRLYRIGYAVGASMEISGVILTVSRL